MAAVKYGKWTCFVQSYKSSPSSSTSACRRLYAVGWVIRKYRRFVMALEVVSDPATIASEPRKGEVFRTLPTVT